MKRRTTIAVIVAVFFGIIAGFLIGISVEYPRVNNDAISGTIGKVKKYSNAKATEAELKLQNDLASDTILLNSMKNYLNFYYANALDLGEKIEMAVNESKSNEDFSTKYNNNIAAIQRYGQFLNSSRTDLLMMLVLCNDPQNTNAVLLKNFSMQINNIVTRTNYYRNSVIDFINIIENYITEKPKASVKGLEKAHDLLAYNQAITAAVTNDKVLLKYLDKKRFFVTDMESGEVDAIKNKIEIDKLQLKSFWDSEKLGTGFNDFEKLGFLDVEKMGRIIAYDSEKLGITFFDSEKLGFLDVEKMGRVIALDSEKLGFWSNISSNELGRTLLFDSEKLGGFFDSEKLGAGFTDSEKMGAFN
ncbi:MAG: hypothetical protein A2X19_01500 [Bacteroidetes bacterium GWE2_39_28]|nr:MAG: hypothetical protein A2X19_01500 [Bacteroidetes bacterium GWE2_39_28]OFY15801.1 MAG: hypothetical protein A2X16_01770 [Bacteroidetes bacterium GWF2_39_10]OFZ06886.1 MAG: hypothetical protein A2322_01565 [Bacteroidetes bacterium RIFOXYB2_FULL_39_7]OFZ09969.1 MAG: hypothetical protein A2465_06710 [Bacteroidetes bacterium RIFOXYC2_FULL_39_11]HCT93512.1 hypothetical protein [Rikenellaceae bacterium]